MVKKVIWYRGFKSNHPNKKHLVFQPYIVTPIKKEKKKDGKR